MNQENNHFSKNTFRAGICDDEPLAIEYVTDCMQKWADENHMTFHLSTFSSAEQFLFETENEPPFDILFLDIQMGKMTGMELARQIRNRDSHVQLVFVTALPDFAAEGYDVSALHYLLKPVSQEKIFKVLDRASRHFAREEAYLLLTDDQTLKRVPVSEILYAEAFAHNLQIVTKNNTYELRESLSSLAQKLGSDFVSPHRSYLVNLQYIHSIARTEIILDTQTRIPLSRYKYQEINQAFILYYQEKIYPGKN